jgi:organic hydroperoxide reductase OsmC/OhrA
MTETTFTVQLEQRKDFEFLVKFDWAGVEDLLLDEPPPLGHSAGPNAARLIGAAVANCLSSSLFFCMRKFRQSPGPLQAQVTGAIDRNERGRLRIGRFDVMIQLADAIDTIAHFDRCAQQFEDFCTVTESIRHGIPVDVRVVDGRGQEVFSTHPAAAAGT